MRSGSSRIELSPIPNGEVVTALAHILNEMNGPKVSDAGSNLSSATGTSDEAEGYSIEASAILDQLSSRGFVISRNSKDPSLGPKIRDTAAAAHRS